MQTISVIVPFYNPPKLSFRKCIGSILNQTYTQIEILLISDGNSKDFDDIAEEYCVLDSRCKLIKKANGGVSSARNQGIKKATGDYIVFVDSDDWVEENYLSKLFIAIQDSDIAICGVGTQIFEVFDRWEDKRLFWSQPSRYNGIQYINFCANKLFKSEIINKYNIQFREDITLGEDALFLNEYYKHCSSFRCISNHLYHYEYNINSAVFNYNYKFWTMEKNVIEAQWYAFHQYCLCPEQENVMVAWLYIKFKNVFYYYLDNENNNMLIDDILFQVSRHSLFKYLVATKLNINLNKKDRIIISIWNKLGIRGIKLIKRISKIMKYMNSR